MLGVKENLGEKWQRENLLSCASRLRITVTLEEPSEKAKELIVVLSFWLPLDQVKMISIFSSKKNKQ